jgi:hypothetical protein
MVSRVRSESFATIWRQRAEMDIGSVIVDELLAKKSKESALIEMTSAIKNAVCLSCSHF